MRVNISKKDFNSIRLELCIDRVKKDYRIKNGEEVIHTKFGNLYCNNDNYAVDFRLLTSMGYYGSKHIEFVPSSLLGS